uniref:Uncharacterized protein n=1 Tax=Globisporangium ultimum (strain ATCC 200006 / CBS 805.95 / DAOM BR144) TaxID=431595 RepID=K3X9J4_GLOUD
MAPRTSKNAYVVPDSRNPRDALQKVAPPKKKRQPRRRLPLREILHLVHRFLILCAAISYVGISLEAGIKAAGLIGGDSTPTVSEGPYDSEALREHLGTTTLRASPLVVDALQNDTSPRLTEVLYVDLNGSSSFEDCGVIPEIVMEIYTAKYMRSLYTALVRDTAYNLTFLAEDTTEFIVPVVDCSSSLLSAADETIAQFNILLRKKHDIDDVYMLTITFANQGYTMLAEKQYGSAGVATITFLNDLQADHVDVFYVVSVGYPYTTFNFRVYQFENITDDGLWTLKKIPNGDHADIPNTVLTGTRSGFYIKSDSNQGNFFSELWEVYNTSADAITGCNWVSKSYLIDAWAWTHFVQLLFACELLSSLVVLTMVSYRNFLAGRLWIGDAFVSVSSRNFLRALLVILTWYINGFWTFLEFVVFDANRFSDLSHVTIHEVIIFADLMTIYLGICGIIGKLCRERVDPLVAIFSFELGFANRFAIKNWISTFVFELETFYSEFYELALPDRIEGQTKISPMRFWSISEINSASIPLKPIFIVLTPIVSTLGIVLVFILGKKIHRYYVPDPLHIQHTTGVSGATGRSGNDDTSALQARKSVLTLFEIATGAKLANRFGLLAEYDNCLFIKGMKFASADGVYSNGFIIVNKKYLIQASDFWAILVMKILRVRYANLYMHEVNGSTVEKMARLVYPNTFSWIDLINLNTSVLS